MRLILGEGWRTDLSDIEEGQAFAAFLKGMVLPTTVVKSIEYGGFASIALYRESFSLTAIEADQIECWANLPKFVIKREG